MKVKLFDITDDARVLAAPETDDGSGVGARYADVLVKAARATLEDGRKVKLKRRGLKLTLAIGEEKADGLLRRLEHGPDARRMFAEALGEAATGLGARYLEDGESGYLELA